MIRETPTIDWAGLSPLLALLGGALVVLVVGLLPPAFVRETLVPLLAIASLGARSGCRSGSGASDIDLMEGALRSTSSRCRSPCCSASPASRRRCCPGGTSRRARPRTASSTPAAERDGGMFVLVAAQNLVTLFLGLELLSIPLYVLCAAETRREGSLESGLKYLIVGSVGSATLLFGLAFLYGATGSTDFAGIAQAIDGPLADDSLLLGGIALALVGLAFKASVAPFHQWTPDVYEGAPTPVTAFMAVATKAAAFGVPLRLFDVALIGGSDVWRRRSPCSPRSRSSSATSARSGSRR